MCLDPDLIVQSKVKLNQDDFPQRFYQVAFVAIQNLYKNLAKSISSVDVDIYLSKFPEQYEIFNKNDGIKFLDESMEFANLDTFEYHATRIKKFSVLRILDTLGFPIDDIYNEKKDDVSKAFDNMALEEIINHFNSKLGLAEKVINQYDEAVQVSHEMASLIDQYELTPEMGLSTGLKNLDEILLGLRKKYYIFSSASGYGKTRLLTYLACQTGINHNVPTLLITTELSLDEIQSIILAYFSKIPERRIILNKTTVEEKADLKRIAEELKNFNLYIVYMPDYNIEKIEHMIKKYMHLYGIQYVYFDYIKETLSILTEVSKRTEGNIELKSHQILMLLSERLKSLSAQYDIGVYTATQVSSEYFSKGGKKGDQSMISGAKAIVHFADVAGILRPAYDKEVTDFNLDMFDAKKTPGSRHVFLDIFKNRRSISNVSVGMSIDLGLLRYKETVVIRDGKIYVPEID